MLNMSIDTADITAKGCRWIRTADDRIVEYSVTGSERPDARVLVSGYFAGMPEPASWLQAYETLNIKMINISYPGLGLSTVQPGRKVIDWPEADVVPVLEAEGVGEFTVYGSSYGSPHAMAVAQQLGPERVRAMGLRVPYFGLPLSTELNLPDGQMRFPTSDELRRNTFKVKMWRSVIGLTGGVVGKLFSNPSKLTLALARRGLLGSLGKAQIKLRLDYPEETAYLNAANDGLFAHPDTMLYMMPQDIAVDLPGLDPRKIQLSGERVVVWYASDDTDCPPSHGEWLAKHFNAKTRVLEGYGHPGGAFIDQVQFFEELMGQP